MRSMACFSSIHFHQRLKKRLVAQVVKDQVPGFELLDALAQAIVGGKQNAPQHALLGFDGVGRQAVNFGRAGGGGSLAAGFF